MVGCSPWAWDSDGFSWEGTLFRPQPFTTTKQKGPNAPISQDFFGIQKSLLDTVQLDQSSCINDYQPISPSYSWSNWNSLIKLYPHHVSPSCIIIFMLTHVKPHWRKHHIWMDRVKTRQGHQALAVQQQWPRSNGAGEGNSVPAQNLRWVLVACCFYPGAGTIVEECWRVGHMGTPIPE